jgi:hypothetical protein
MADSLNRQMSELHALREKVAAERTRNQAKTPRRPVVHLRRVGGRRGLDADNAAVRVPVGRQESRTEVICAAITHIYRQGGSSIMRGAQKIP